MIASLSGQTLVGPMAASGLWVACPDSPLHMGSFLWSGTRDGFPLQKQRRGPFCPSGDPRPIISTDYRWPVWQPYWLRERLFHPVPPSPLFSMETEIFSHFVSTLWKRTGKKKETPQKGEKSTTHLFPFTVFPLASPIHIWLQRLFELKKPFVCLRSYWSLINCKLVRHQVSVPSVGKARLQLLFFFFWKAALLTLPRPLKRNAIRVDLR